MRGLSNDVKTALTQRNIRPVTFVRLEFGASTIVRLTDLGRDITWDSQTWIGNGALKPIRSILETADVRPLQCEVQIVGEITQFISYALNDARYSNKVKIWLGFLDATNQLIADPYLMFSGRLDVPRITANGRETIVSLAYESDLKLLNRNNEFRFTNESQRAIYSDDAGFQYVELMESWDGYWGVPEKPKWLKRKRNTKK